MNKNHKFTPAFLLPIQYVDGVVDTNNPVAVQCNRESVKLVDIVVPIIYKDEKGNEGLVQKSYTVVLADLIAATTAMGIASKE